LRQSLTLLLRLVLDSWSSCLCLPSAGIASMSHHARQMACGTVAWTQGLHLESLHQPFFCEGFFWGMASQTICLVWLWTTILLICASWVARITSMSTSAQLDGRF
jgi:hypothetical protein